MWYDRKNKSFWLLVYILVVQLTITQARNVVPVMLWSKEASSNLVNPLYKTSRPEFEEILAEKIGKGQSPIVVFLKDNFCVEDIKHHNESLQTLNNVGSLTYLTSVESASSVFENLSSCNITMEDDLESIDKCQLALVQVTDLNAIPEIYNMLRESSLNLIVALTGKSCSYTSSERVKREAFNNSTSNSKISIAIKNKILFYADESPWIKLNNEYEQLGKVTDWVGNITDKNYNLKIEFEGTSSEPNKIYLEAKFEKADHYFTLTGFEYSTGSNSTTFKSRNAIVFPETVSYHCGGDNIFIGKAKSGKIFLKIKNLQVQMDAEKFGEVYDCVGFMSIPIWTGIFVTAILALIMIWGLTMIMDIRTMDRFDDPKGKTITISAQE